MVLCGTSVPLATLAGCLGPANVEDERCVPGPAGTINVDLLGDAGPADADAAPFSGDAASLVDGGTCGSACPRMNTFANNVGLSSCTFQVSAAGRPIAHCVYACF